MAAVPHAVLDVVNHRIGAKGRDAAAMRWMELKDAQRTGQANSVGHGKNPAYIPASPILAVRTPRVFCASWGRKKGHLEWHGRVFVHPFRWKTAGRSGLRGLLLRMGLHPRPARITGRASDPPRAPRVLRAFHVGRGVGFS